MDCSSDPSQLKTDWLISRIGSVRVVYLVHVTRLYPTPVESRASCLKVDWPRAILYLMTFWMNGTTDDYFHAVLHSYCDCSVCQQAAQREETYEETIRDLTERLKDVSKQLSNRTNAINFLRHETHGRIRKMFQCTCDSWVISMLAYSWVTLAALSHSQSSDVYALYVSE